MTDWLALRTQARMTDPATHEKSWNELPPLWNIYEEGFKFSDDDIREAPDLQFLAYKYLGDIVTAELTRAFVWRENRFMWDMFERYSQHQHLTIGMARGVLNVFMGRISANRRRFWKSRDKRRDRNDGLESCIICGGPLTSDSPVNRAMGDTCYRRVMGDQR